MRKIFFIFLVSPIFCFGQEISLIESWVELYGHTPKAYMMAAPRAKSYKDQISLYSKAIELDSAYTSAWYERAILKRVNGDLSGAFKDFTNVIILGDYLNEIYPDSIYLNYQVINSYKERALLNLFNKNLEEACNDYSDYFVMGGEDRIEDSDLENYCKKSALEKARQYKEYLDLELISKEYYDNIKSRLIPLILLND